MPFGMSDTFEVKPLPTNENVGWGSVISKPEIENEEEKKKLFGIELAKGNIPFDAALLVTNDNAGLALWICNNWTNDPEVIAARDLYINSVGTQSKILDKEQTAVKFLQIADDKRNGRYTAETKDRLRALELYAKLCGYLNDTIINNNPSNVVNKISVVLVKPQQQEDNKIIDVVPTSVENPSNLSIKLVKSA